MQLLTASKSLMDVKEASGRYRMAQGNLLPKFNSTAGAGSPPSTAQAEPVKPMTASPFRNQFCVGSETNSKKGFIRSVLTRGRESILKSSRTLFVSYANGCSLVTAALKKIKPRSYWNGRQPAANAEKIKSIKPAVQGELSLDNVKVVRNDLSDTDLEIVPVTNLEQSDAPKAVSVLVNVSSRRGVNGSAPAEVVNPATPRGESTGTSWGRLASRIFGSGQTSS